MNARFVYSHPLVAVFVFFIRHMNTVTENTHVQLFLDTCFHFSTSGDAESQDSPEKLLSCFPEPEPFFKILPTL